MLSPFGFHQIRPVIMGFCDDLTMEKADPQYGISAGAVFQTKSLYAGGGHFMITADGRLVEHRYRYEPAVEPKFPLAKRVHIGDREIEFHGDILLYGAAADERFRELVVRFTHGRVEWIRPLDQYPEANRTLLIEQGAR